MGRKNKIKMQSLQEKVQKAEKVSDQIVKYKGLLKKYFKNQTEENRKTANFHLKTLFKLNDEYRA